MRLSNLADYAVVMLAAAARLPGGRLTATLLAEETHVPLPTAQKLVGKLAAAGLLVSSRGAGGGFRLARPAERISLAEIIEAVEGPIAMTACVEQARHDCAAEDRCRVKPHWNVVNGAVRDALANVTLASLASPPLAPNSPLVLSEVEGRASGDPLAARASTSLSTNGSFMSSSVEVSS